MEALLERSEQEIELIEAATKVAASLSCFIYDVELKPGHVKVVVDKDGGVDLDTLEEINKRLYVQSDFLKIFDPKKHSLEVSSPGIERKLRTPEHFIKAVGQKIKVKLVQGSPERRVTGILKGVTGSKIEIQKISDAEILTLYLQDIESATTVFDWPENFSPKGDK